MTLEQSIKARTDVGMELVSRAEFERRWNDAGFRFDPTCAVSDTARYMTGEFAGESEPYLALYPVRQETGLSAFHVNTPDAVRATVRELRNGFFAVSRGRIVEV